MNFNPSNIDAENLSNVQETLQRINFASGEKAEEALKGALEDALKKGIMPKTALQINDETMEAIYTQGYNLYNQGKFKESSYIFRLLMLLDFTTPKYVLGLAACAHRLKDYPNAANLYLLCAALDPTNPLPHFHSADCYLQLKMPTTALFSLGMAITAAGNQSQYALVKDRAILMKQALDQQLESGSVEVPKQTALEPEKPAEVKVVRREKEIEL
jgi:type III secretion system low calcium response chaperone LcrH/SycD